MRAVVETDVLSVEDKREIINRVAKSDIFRRAPKLREFLIYVADCTLEDRLEDVRAQAIAEKVFHRTPERYDGGDTIVRAEARNLRKRLESYFETDGAAEPYQVVMPKGGYLLAFKAREPVPVSVRDASESATASVATSIPQSVASDRTQPVTPRILLVLCLCLGVLAATTLALAIHWYPGESKASSVTRSRPALLPFSALFDPRRDTVIITSDTAFLKICNLEGHRLTLNEYLTRAYPPVPHLFPPNLIRDLNWSEFTDAAETNIAGLMMKKNANYLQRTLLRSGRQVQVDDFKNQNVILLGSPISNPWAELYARQLNFQFDENKKQEIILLNRSPQRGELPLYPSKQDDEMNPKYAQIAFLPGASPASGSTLLIGGTTAEATEAAGEFVLDDAVLSKTLQRIGVDLSGSPRYWEIVLRATTFVGGATHAEVIAYRLHPRAVE